MKTIKILLASIFCFAIAEGTQAQFIEKMANKAKKKIEREAEERTERRVNKGIDKAFDKTEKGIDGAVKGDNKAKQSNPNSKAGNNQHSEAKNSSANNEQNLTIEPDKTQVQWSRFDFVPGDEVIFEDAPDIMEENGEFPSRWDAVGGQTEIANVDGENVILFIDGSPEIVPYLKKSNEDYLPEVFTIEFDLFKPAGSNRFFCNMYDAKNQRANGNKEITIGHNYISIGDFEAKYPSSEYTRDKDRWLHISIAYTKGKLKMYMDDTRLINIPRYEANPTGFSMQAYFADMSKGINFLVKNIRIAKGGVKYYDRILSEGKIICNGIRFDVDKATLKPESMGPINKIYELMTKQPDLKFSVEGHTDSDGDDARNQTLSENRAKTVMKQLVQMGINKDRLTSKGFGETMPLADNNTPEGKANNRRVEFVKFTGLTSTPQTKNSASNSKFDKLNPQGIKQNLDDLPNVNTIPISNKNGIVNGTGTVIVYATSDGNIGKLEILDINKDDNYKLTVRFVSYNAKGAIESQSNKLVIPGTYTCDLDKGKIEGVIYSEQDFHFSRQDKHTSSINPGEISILKIVQ